MTNFNGKDEDFGFWPLKPYLIPVFFFWLHSCLTRLLFMPSDGWTLPSPTGRFLLKHSLTLKHSSHWGRLCFSKMAMAIFLVPDALPEPCHPSIQTWNLFLLPLKLNGTFWLPQQIWRNRSDAEWLLKVNHKRWYAFCILVINNWKMKMFKKCHLQ